VREPERARAAIVGSMIDIFAKPLLEYRQAFRAYWKLKDGELPRFDVVLLGMEVE
jgi:hypothetical protein